MPWRPITITMAEPTAARTRETGSLSIRFFVSSAPELRQLIDREVKAYNYNWKSYVFLQVLFLIWRVRCYIML